MACSKREGSPRPQIGEAREMSPSASGAQRFEVRCVAKSQCETQARRLCPEGYLIQREWTDSGTRGRPPLADREEPGNADPNHLHNNTGDQAHHGLLVECQSLGLSGES